MKVSEHDGRVVLWAADWLGVYEPGAGAFAGSFAPNEAIRDVDLRHDTGQLIVTGDTVWQGDTPFTTVYVRKPEDASTICQVQVPNCADELVLRPDGARAFLAPTFCAKDPVSVIDLSSCSFEKNLPGFGPVALSQNGQTAVAFIDVANDDPTAPPLPEEVKKSDSRYHLMMIDVDTLEFDTLAVGSELPRYAVTPDGQMLLVDAFMSENNVRILDIDMRSLRTIEGAYVLLENFVMHPNSRQVFGLYQGLFEIDVPAAKSRTIGLSFTPDSINMLPSGDTLLLKDRDSRIHMFDVASERVTGRIGM
jgi:DNA-binding beta-propeller fold protein YncE